MTHASRILGNRRRRNTLIGAAAFIILMITVASAYAWNVNKPVVTAICKAPINTALMYVTGTITNNETTANGDMIVTMKTIYGDDTRPVLHGETADFDVPTNLQSIPPGTATFELKWLNGRKGMDTLPSVSYDAGACQQPEQPTTPPVETQPEQPVQSTPVAVIVPTTPTHTVHRPTPKVTGGVVSKAIPGRTHNHVNYTAKIKARYRINFGPNRPTNFTTSVLLVDSMPRGMVASNGARIVSKVVKNVRPGQVIPWSPVFHMTPAALFKTVCNHVDFYVWAKNPVTDKYGWVFIDTAKACTYDP